MYFFVPDISMFLHYEIVRALLSILILYLHPHLDIGTDNKYIIKLIAVIK